MMCVKPAPREPAAARRTHRAGVVDGAPRRPLLVVELNAGLFGRVKQGFEDHDWGGLRQSHFRLLAAVPSSGTSITELAERLAMTKQGCGQHVTALTSSGHLTTAPGTGDRRVRLVRRTSAGDAMLARVIVRMRELEQEWADRVGPERYAVFREVMQELAGDLARPVDEPAAPPR